MMKTGLDHLALPTLLLAGLLVAPVTQAQTGLLECAAMAEDAARLQCYDQLAAALRGAPGTDAVSAAAVPESTATGPANAGPVPGDQRALALFGFESRPEEQRQVTEVLDRLEAGISKASHNPFSGWTLTLDNGQVWKQLGSDRFDIAPGDQAVITRGSLNSFLLQRSGEGRRIRVSRVE